MKIPKFLYISYADELGDDLCMYISTSLEELIKTIKQKRLGLGLVHLLELSPAKCYKWITTSFYDEDELNETINILVDVDFDASDAYVVCRKSNYDSTEYDDRFVGLRVEINFGKTQFQNQDEQYNEFIIRRSYHVKQINFYTTFKDAKCHRIGDFTIFFKNCVDIQYHINYISAIIAIQRRWRCLQLYRKRKRWIIAKESAYHPLAAIPKLKKKFEKKCSLQIQKE